MRSLRFTCWTLASIFVVIAVLNYAFFGRLNPNAASVLPATMNLAGILLGAAITVEAQYHHAQSEYKRQLEISRKTQLHQLRLAAIDKRLEAHQQAYTLWWVLMGCVYDDDKRTDHVMKCQEWWSENCLLLSPEASKAFRSAYLAASHHKSYVQTHQNENLIKDNWVDIKDAGDIIAKSAGLPEFGATPNEIDAKT